MTQAQSSAQRIRWFMLALAIACWLAGFFWLINIVWPRWEIFPGDLKTGAGLFGVLGWWWEDKGQWAYFFSVVLYVGVFLMTQWFFLRPRGSWRIQIAQTGRPMSLSVLSAALMGALLTVGLMAVVLQVLGWWQSFAYRDMPEHPRYGPALLALAIAWGLWAALFFIYARQRDQYTWLGKILRGLIAGSILELLVASVVHAVSLSTGDKDCYCARGSYTGLVLGGTVLLWCFGPGVTLLFLREKQRREKLPHQGDHI